MSTSPDPVVIRGPVTRPGPQTAAPRMPGPRGRGAVLAALFCCGWGGNQFTPLLLMYRRLGGYSTVTVDAFLGAYVVGLVPGLLVASAVSDRRGRRPVLVPGTALSVLASAVLAFGDLGGAGPVYAGRLLSGAAVGVAMAVGTSWVKELSQPPWDTSADAGTGARRASLALTLGFGLGAGCAGVLAQWGPWPMVTPYLVHVLVTLPVLVALLRRAPETRARRRPTTGLAADLRVPCAGHRRFLRMVVPMAPWVFGAAGVAYAVMPQLVEARVGHWGLMYATALTVLTLGVGAAVQPLARRLDRHGSARAGVSAMVAMATGMAVCTVNAGLRQPLLGLVGALVLGAAYGVAVVSGLLEVQRIATPDDLAGLTGVYYALAYSGFLLPTVLAALSQLLGYPLMLGALTATALGCTVVMATSSTVPLAPPDGAAPDPDPARPEPSGT